MLGSARAALLVGVLSTLPGAAAGQEVSGLVQEESDPDTERARQLFQEGLRLADEGDWERAVHRFRGALELRESGPVRVNLARSLVEMGRLVEALEEANRVAADHTAHAEARAAADALRSEIRPRLGRLQVTVDQDAAGTMVTVDGRPWQTLGQPVISDPGIRVVRLLFEQRELDLTEADVPEGGVARVQLEVPASFFLSTTPTEGADEGGGDGGVVAGIAVTVLLLVLGGAAAVTTWAILDMQGTDGDFMPGVLDVGE